MWIFSPKYTLFSGSIGAIFIYKGNIYFIFHRKFYTKYLLPQGSCTLEDMDEKVWYEVEAGFCSQLCHNVIVGLESVHWFL